MEKEGLVAPMHKWHAKILLISSRTEHSNTFHEIKKTLEEYVTDRTHHSPTSATPHKSKQRKHVQEEAIEFAEHTSAIKATPEREIAVTESDKGEIESLAIDDDDWEETWEQPPLISTANPKTQSSVPIHTRTEELQDKITADQFWCQ
eukprot:12790754-Ditylum_brightwellii.AAC.1